MNDMEMEHGQPQGNRQPACRPDGEICADPGADGAGPLPVDRALSLVGALARAGTLQLTADESRALMAAFPPGAVKQKENFNRRNPNASRVENYIPHILISRRLNEVLGIGQWCLVRLREWLDGRTNEVYASWCMVVRGVWVGDCVSSWGYRADNPNDSYDNALEAARGVALRRIAAKALSVGDQVWAEDAAPRPQAAPSRPAEPAQGPTGQEWRELLARGRQAASFGSGTLKGWWEARTREERVSLADQLHMLKQAASAADAVAEQAARTGDEMAKAM